MNIMQILPELNVGGVETGVLDLTKYLTRLGHKIVVVSGGGRLVGELEAYGGIHYQLPVHKKSLFNILRLIPKVAEIIKKENIQLVHARSRNPAWIAYFACKKTKTPFITTCHGYYKKHPFSSIMGWGKIVIAPSVAVARHMQKDFSVPYERIRIIPRGVNMEKFRYIPYSKKSKTPYYIGMIGRLTPWKGHPYFLRAMARVARVFPHVRILIVGDAHNKKRYEEELKILSKRLGLDNITEFIPSLRDVSTIMERLNLLVHASIEPEPFGRVIIEAQASGVPVVATRLGGPVEIIEDEKTGLLVAPLDPEDMAKAVIRIMQDEDLALRISESSYEKVKEKYNLDNFAQATLKVYEEVLNKINILLIKISALGDVILFIPTLKLIRKHFSSNYRIAVLVGEDYKEVFLNCPHIDELIVYDSKGKDKGIFALLRISRVLKKKNFDFYVDFQNNYRSHLIGFLSGIPLRYGFDRKLGFLLNRKVVFSKMDKGPLEHQARILKLLDIEFEEEELELWPTKQDEKYIEEFLDSYWVSSRTKLIGINIGASQKWPTKVWPVEYMAELCEQLARRDLRLVITGTDKDFILVQDLINRIYPLKPINACGRTTINQLACLIRRCKVYISADSAPLHIACAVKTPCIAIFGPTDPKSHLVLKENVVLLYKDLACSPCYKKTCKSKECMYKIQPQEVLEAIERILSK
ncbi:MAG: glycosyltransferase [Candidatus Omnitrophica bacterium]|nr:glycosyltransferase [Candidatus Omnitrophota bacterium]